MKRILLLLVLLWSLGAEAQLFNNEWIDYNKTYYKFKIGATGAYHITQPTLASLGFGAVQCRSFPVVEKWPASAYLYNCAECSTWSF